MTEYSGVEAAFDVNEARQKALEKARDFLDGCDGFGLVLLRLDDVKGMGQPKWAALSMGSGIHTPGGLSALLRESSHLCNMLMRLGKASDCECPKCHAESLPMQ